VGFEVTYDGIRQTPAEIVAKARETNAHVSASRSCQARMCRWCAR
jgi:methylmalonyl-CoA mutase cobalamin-binding subunit